jgi:hypothetical protein
MAGARALIDTEQPLMDSSSSNDTSLVHRRPPRFRLWGSAVAVMLVGTTLGLVAAREGVTAVPNVPPVPQAHAVPITAADGAAKREFSRFTLNALLVPLLDDSEPPRWTDVALRHFCGPQTRVEIDGRPLVPGMTIPATAFTVRWTIDQCWPLDYSAFELSGAVELQVFHEDTGLSAIVSAQGLRVLGTRGASRFDRPFAAAMQLL